MCHVVKLGSLTSLHLFFAAAVVGRFLRAWLQHDLSFDMEPDPSGSRPPAGTQAPGILRTRTHQRISAEENVVLRIYNVRMYLVFAKTIYNKFPKLTLKKLIKTCESEFASRIKARNVENAPLSTAGAICVRVLWTRSSRLPST